MVYGKYLGYGDKGNNGEAIAITLRRIFVSSKGAKTQRKDYKHYKASCISLASV